MVKIVVYASLTAATLGLVVLFGAAERTIGTMALGVGLVAVGASGLFGAYRLDAPASSAGPRGRGSQRPPIDHQRVAKEARATLIQELSLRALPSGEWEGAVDGCPLKFRVSAQGALVRVMLPRPVALSIPSRADLGHDDPYAPDNPPFAGPDQVLLSDPALPKERIVCAKPLAEAWTSALKQLPPRLLAGVFFELGTRLSTDGLSLDADVTGAADGAAAGRHLAERVRAAAKLARLLAEAAEAIEQRSA